MPKAKETGSASAPAKKTAGRRSYRSYGKIKPAPGKSKAEPKPIKVSFLGGLNEVGKNMTLFEYGEDMFLVDCGLAFPDQDMLGVDLVLPDFTYVERNADRIRGIVITHGHEDHIGGLPYLLKVLNVPVYGTKLTIGLIQGKLREHGLLNSASLNVINPGDVITLGGFTVEAIHVNHSIPDALGLAIRCEGGTIVHTGDFKIDTTPIDGGMMDLGRLAEIGQEGVLCLMSDSTNAERPGFTESERKVGESFETLFRKAGNNRIIVATFSSNIHRVQQIMNVAASLGRKVALVGRSLENVVSISAELGYLNVPEGIVIDINMINRYPADKLVIITTGSQGEPMSALTRMAFSDHRKVEIHPNDYVIISATPIPGNEKTVSRVVNELMKLGADVVYEKMYEVHVSGHACQEELKMIMGIVKPKYFIPVHGELKHLRKHAGLALSMGIPKENILIADNGRVAEISKKALRCTSTVPAGRVFVDGYGVGDVGSVVLRDRKHLAQDGLVIVAVCIDRESGMIVSGPDVVTRGFVYVKESEELINAAREVAVEAIEAQTDGGYFDWNSIKASIRDEISHLMYERTKRSPMILPVIMEV
ncbi:MAG: ribonuclease J [Oscillospiraceae bacterium]|nr:ribonuclease J [Oscillospiraceae bacterium]MCI7489007.1 ribonuclease J [Oscillospiraceae bacterium]